jgi:hypothetical protein
VTLISVRHDPITSSPTSSSPRAASTGPSASAISRSRGVSGMRHAAPAGGQVAARLPALRDARQREGHRPPADEQHALVALRDLGQVLLHHDGGGAVAVERLGDGPEVQAVGADAEDAHAAHAVQRLEDDVAVLGVEGADGRGAARHERGRDELRELEDGELLGVVAQRRGAVEDACTLALGLPEQVRGVEVFAVEGRVLAHDHRAGIAQGAGGVLGRDLEPGLPVVFPAGEHDLPGPRR